MPDTDPEMRRMHGLLMQVQQRTEQMKRMREARAQQPQPGPSIATCTLGSATGNAESHKRKDGPEDDQENIPPAKRMAISNVIDLT